MANKISDETIEYVGILAKLELSGQEKEDAKADMEKMLDYIDTLNELDTDGIEPRLSHVFICVAQLDFAVELLKNLFHFIASYRGVSRIVGGVCGMTYRRRGKCGDYENI